MSSFSLNATGAVSSRFVSQSELDQAKANKDEEWKAAYARIGQEPPPRPQEEEYDPRSLFEKLQHNKDVKREEWDEKMKMGNQFRGLDSEEINFLAAEKTRSEKEDQARRRADEDILAAFRSAQRRSPSPPPSLLPPSISTPSTITTVISGPKPSLPAPKAKAKPKSKLPAGVIVKKKAPPPKEAAGKAPGPEKASEEGGKKRALEEEDDQAIKRSEDGDAEKGPGEKKPRC